jgi:HAD superfamily hydrolase (TIGR01549 family)
MYDYLIFDADHTLIDFYADERAAFRRTFARFGGIYTEEDVETARKISDAAWAEAGLNDVHLQSVQDDFHRRYFAHLPGLVARIKKVVPMPASDQEIADFFVRELYVPAIPVGNAEAVFRSYAARYKTCIATNGITDMQRVRLQAFLPYTYKLFVSEELHTIKPNPAFFLAMVNELHTDVKNCLFIGDSLSSDVAGCAAVGMDCVWVNPKKIPLPAHLSVKAQIGSIDELNSVLW